MNHYQKLAVLFLRIVGIICASIGILGLGYAAFMYFIFNRLIPGVERWPSNIFYAIFGIVVYLLSPVIGKSIGKGLE